MGRTPVAYAVGLLLMELTPLFAPQNRRLIKLPPRPSVSRSRYWSDFCGTEGLSTLFSFELSLISQDARLELKSLIGQLALLGLTWLPVGPGYSWLYQPFQPARQ